MRARSLKKMKSDDFEVRMRLSSFPACGIKMADRGAHLTVTVRWDAGGGRMRGGVSRYDVNF